MTEPTTTTRRDPTAGYDIQRNPMATAAILGLTAGAIFLLAELIVAAAMPAATSTPLRLFASVVMGGAAMTTASLGAVIIVGLIVHFALSAVFGTIYGAVARRAVPLDLRRRWGPHAAAGAAFGFVLWLVNFQIIARVLYPWFLEAPQFAQLFLHVVFYGLPLGLLFANLERRLPLPSASPVAERERERTREHEPVGRP